MRHSRDGRRSVLAAVLTLQMAFLVLGVGCNSRTKTSQQLDSKIRVSVMNFGGAMDMREIELKPSDDPANPYKSQYRDWDLWAIANLKKAELQNVYMSMPGSRTLTVGIDPNGYIIPQLELARWYEDSLMTELHLENYHTRVFATFAHGSMNDKLYSELQSALDKLRASYFRPIPQWLVDSPPAGAILYPNGEVITMGPLGASVEDQKKMGVLEQHRFSKDGVELGVTDGTMFQLYHNYLEKGKPDGEFSNRLDGYVIYRDEAGKVLSVWEYDGTKLPTTVEPPARDCHPFRILSRDQIVRYGRIQRENR